MRLISLCSFFLLASTVLALPLALSSGGGDYLDISLRDDVPDQSLGVVTRFVSEDETSLVKRIIAAKKHANKQARKTNRKAKKQEAKTAAQKATNKVDKAAQKEHNDAQKKYYQEHKAKMPPMSPAAAAKHAQDHANNRKSAAQAAKQKLRDEAHSKHLRVKAAGAAHRQTTGLPARTANFHIPGGNNKPALTFTGKDVRKANFASHIPNTVGQRFGKVFNNDKHIDAGHSHTDRPIPHMNGVGHEHPLSGATTHSQMNHDHMNSPVRIISQMHHDGSSVHMGVISHDQSRDSSHKGVNDHFLVNPT
ncbi:hypothetical protein CPC08DRAFT_767658 [Agrocybe pediades]|nr:hypothetical protein CPC08DRAFT_767658 [Agrocybe pediades]